MFRFRTFARTAVCVCCVAFVACGDDGGGTIGGGGGGSIDGTPAVDGGTVSDNGAFSFEPGPAGSAPGLRVEAVTADGTFASTEREVRLDPWDGYERVERALGDDGATPDAADVLTVDAIRAVMDEMDVIPARQVITDSYSVDFGRRVDVSVPREVTTAESLASRHLDALRVPESVDDQKDCDGRVAGRFYNTIGTWGSDLTLWIAAGFSFTVTAETSAYVWAIHLAPEGVYLSLQVAAGLTIPPFDAAMGIDESFGFLLDPEVDGEIAGGTLEGTSISLGADLGSLAGLGFSWGITLFKGGDGFLHRAAQLDLGVSASFFSGFLGPLQAAVGSPVSITVAETVFTTQANGAAAFVLTTGWGDPCTEAPKSLDTLEQPLDPADVFVELQANVQSLIDIDPVDARSALQQQIGLALQPLVASMAVPGEAPAEGIAASTNGAWFSDTFERDDQGLCQDCPDLSLDGVLFDTVQNLRVAGGNPAALGSAGAASLQQLAQAWPQPAQQAQLGEEARGALDATFAYAFDRAAELRGDENRFVGDDIFVIETTAGEPFELVIDAAEIADLVDASVDDVLGATVCILVDFSGPRADDVCITLDEPTLVGEMSVGDATSMLMAFSVDLSTAAGFDAETVEGWTVRPDLRLIRSGAADPTEVSIAAPDAVFSGAPVTLSATLVDANGNLVRTPTEFTFFGADEQVLGTVSSETGIATWQYLPEPSTPTVTGFEAATWVLTDGTELDGYAIAGDGLSAYAQVTIDGFAVEDIGWRWATLTDDEGALLPVDDAATAAFDPGLHTIEVVNPGDRSSGAQTLQLP